MDNDNEKLAKFIRIVKQYTEIEELTPDILHSFVDRIYIGETEVYEGQKFQDIKIVYNQGKKRAAKNRDEHHYRNAYHKK